MSSVGVVKLVGMSCTSMCSSQRCITMATVSFNSCSTCSAGVYPSSADLGVDVGVVGVDVGVVGGGRGEGGRESSLS